MTTERCKRCEREGRETAADLTAYWGHPLCAPCAIRTAGDLDERGVWPPVPWSDEEEVLLDG